MTVNAGEKYNERQKMIEDSIALKPTKRMVNAVRVNYWPYYEYGMTLADALKDYKRGNDCFVRFHREFHPDVASMCSGNSPSKIYEIAGLKTVRWPGDPKGLDKNAPFQYIEYETMMEDEYDEFLSTPAEFAIKKFFPRTCSIFEPLTKLDWLSMCTRITGAVDAFTTPEMLDMYKKLSEIAKIRDDYRNYSKELKNTLIEMGYPFISGTGSATAFDMLADTLRCTMGFFADLILQPDNIQKCLDKFVDIHIKSSLAQCKMTGCKYAWVMLHKAFDGFISDETYRTCYWPYLKKWALEMIDHGLIPVLFTEGPYTTRLKYLAELPAGKALVHFEEVDFKEAKRILGGKVCMMGGFPNQLLMFGTPEQVRDKAKEIIDIMGPDGGYMFATSASVDQAERRNMEALFQTIEDYGKS